MNEVHGPDSDSSADTSEPGRLWAMKPEVADHELIKPIGRGSYGVVWLARSVMGVYRAVKVVYRESFRDEKPYRRELEGIRRFEPISRSHDGFVDILQVGAQGHYFYYVMELGDSMSPGALKPGGGFVPRTLGRDIQSRGRLPVDECVRVGVTLTGALAALHDAGLVHRDIKPSNIIYIQGVPKLADIGLVAGLGEQSSFVGTEGFVPPEGPGGSQADIYGLGRVLYEAATGLDRLDYPALPKQLEDAPDLVRFTEFNEVVIKACKPDLRERYASAREMQGDLQLLLDGRSLRRLRQLERRNRLLLRWGMGLGLAALLTAAVVVPSYREMRMRREAAQRRVGARTEAGVQFLESGDYSGALNAFAEAYELDKDALDRVQVHRMRLAAALAKAPKLIDVSALGAVVADARMLPRSEQILATAEGIGLVVWGGGTSNNRTSILRADKEINSSTLSPDGLLVATAGNDRFARVLDPRSGQILSELSHPCRVMRCAFSPDQRRLATAGRDGFARIWDLTSAQLLAAFRAHDDAVVAVAFSGDGRLLATGSWDSTARIWDAGSFQPVHAPLPHETWVASVAFSPDSRALATACHDHTLRLWDCSSGLRLGGDMLHPDGVVSVEFSPDGNLLLTSCHDGIARLWSARTFQLAPRNALLRHGARLLHASFGGSGSQVLTSGWDGIVRAWDLAGGEHSPVEFLGAGSPAGRVLVIAEGSRFGWTSSPKAQPANWLEAGTPIAQCQLPAEDLAVTVDATGAELRVWSFGSRTGAIGSLPIHHPPARIEVGAGRLLCIDGPSVSLYTLPTIAKVGSVVLTNESVVATLSADGQWVALGDQATVRLVRSGALSETGRALLHSQPVARAAFSPDSRLLATACSDNQLTACAAQFWDVPTGARVGVPMPHRDGILSIAFSPDGSQFATGGEDFAARVWDVGSGRPATGWMTHRHQVHSVRFSSDGRLLATLSADWVVRVWDPATGEPITPPLECGGLGEVTFLADPLSVVFTRRNGRSFAWELEAPKWSPSVWLQLGSLLSGAPAIPEALVAGWRQHKTELLVAPDQHTVWLVNQARSCLKSRDWQGARFFVQELGRNALANPELQEQVQQIRRALAEQEPAAHRIP